MTRRLWSSGAVLLIACLVWTSPGWADAQEICPDVPLPSFALPATRAAIAAGQEVLVVALGSSSSRGADASDEAHTYPAVLQARLMTLLPMAHVAVINRGNDGEDATRELARLGPDVRAVRPRLVIWQVGANGALRGTDPAVFHALVAAGVTELQKVGTDIILMDNQRAPKILAAPSRTAIEHALADVASTMGVNMFSRGALMDAWRDRGFPYDDFIGPDGLHHNDRGYRCIADALAKTIAVGVKP